MLRSSPSPPTEGGEGRGEEGRHRWLSLPSDFVILSSFVILETEEKQFEQGRVHDLTG